METDIGNISGQNHPADDGYRPSDKGAELMRKEHIHSTTNRNDMTKTDWLVKFRHCHTLETPETVYENLSYKIPGDEGFAITQAYDHRKAEFAAGKLFDCVPGYVWRFVK